MGQNKTKIKTQLFSTTTQFATYLALFLSNHLDITKYSTDSDETWNKV